MTPSRDYTDPIHPILAVPSFDYTSKGITLREWLAGMAMQGLCSRAGENTGSDWVAKKALAYADAVLQRLAELPTLTTGEKGSAQPLAGVPQ